MISKRTQIDFSKHVVEVTKSEGLLIHYLRIPNSRTNGIKFINTNDILAVTGDFGNWIFCREFHPSSGGSVSEQYWLEKMRYASEQALTEYDPESTANAIKEELNGGLEEYGYKGEELEQMKEYFNECLTYVDDEIEYTYFAYRQLPSFLDYEGVIFMKSIKIWLQCVFDGFDEICRRLKELESKGIEDHPKNFNSSSTDISLTTYTIPDV